MRGLELVALGCMIRDAHLGMGEDGGNNRGAFVRGLLENLDPPLAEGAPWCAAEVQSAFDVGAKQMGVPNPLDAIRREAYVQDYFTFLQGDQVDPSAALRGFLVLFSFGGERWDHIGMVVRPPVVGSPLFTSCEGNTGPGVGATTEEQERDGDGVFVKMRRLDQGYRVTFIDPIGVSE
jgi:hypothetical protein